MGKNCTIIIITAILFGVIAPASGITVDKIVRNVDNRYKTLDAFSASMWLIATSAYLGDATYKGKIYARHPNNFRLEYYEPMKQTLVFDGSTFWMYTPMTKQVIIYDKLDATQTQIQIGGLGIPTGHEDHPALEVARVVYGGSFTSRLMDEIRVNRGLSYSVRFRSTRYRQGGVVYTTTFTKNETVGEVVDIILGEAVTMQTEIVPDEEFNGAVNYACGTYPMRFETNDHLVGVFSNMWLNGLDKAHYEDHQERLRAVTQAQVTEAANKYLARDNYRLILVGKADEITTQAEKFGPVTVIPLAGE